MLYFESVGMGEKHKSHASKAGNSAGDKANHTLVFAAKLDRDKAPMAERCLTSPSLIINAALSSVDIATTGNNELSRCAWQMKRNFRPDSSTITRRDCLFLT